MDEVVFYHILLAVITVYGMYHYDKLGKSYQFLVVLISIAFCVETMGFALYHTIGTNFPTYHFMVNSAIILHTLIYYNLAKISRREKIALIAAGAILSSLSILSSIFIQPPLQFFPSNNIILLSLFTVVLCITTFIKMIHSASATPLSEQPLFWLNLANFMFYTLTFFSFAFLSHFNGQDHRWMDVLIWNLNMVMYLIYFKALHTEKLLKTAK